MHRLILITNLLLTATLATAQLTPSSDLEPVPQYQCAAKNITPPELINKEPADYPFDARFQEISGACLVSLVVGIDGIPQKTHIIHCTDSSFEDTSLQAVRDFRFKPATTKDGKPVLVQMAILQRYHMEKISVGLRMLMNTSWVPDLRLGIDRFITKGEFNHELSQPIHHLFIPQQGGDSVPDAEGIYPLTRSVTGPRVLKFADEGYSRLAFFNEGNSTCDIVLTIDKKGKASEPHVTHCEKPELEQPAIKSLLKSNYKPGMIHGKDVSMRGTVHLIYGELPGDTSLSTH